jgi:hypothetical protein
MCGFSGVILTVSPLKSPAQFASVVVVITASAYSLPWMGADLHDLQRLVRNCGDGV